jgi:two-component system, cell cycle sensor histidine kinase and response regulator CckA
MDGTREKNVARLTEGLAGYSKQFLSLILGYGCAVQSRLSAGEALQPHLYEMLVLHERAALIARSLSVFSKKHVMHPAVVKLSEIVTRASWLMKGIVGKRVELRVSVGREDPTIYADPVQMEQALMNLATNARDAMPGGGILTLKSGTLRIENRFAERHGAAAWKCAFISMSDTGTGIDEETRPRIFEPFYSTKPAGKGVGLGLPVVKGIIQQHNGSIGVSSEPGKGATFTL